MRPGAREDLAAPAERIGRGVEIEPLGIVVRGGRQEQRDRPGAVRDEGVRVGRDPSAVGRCEESGREPHVAPGRAAERVGRVHDPPGELERVSLRYPDGGVLFARQADPDVERGFGAGAQADNEDVVHGGTEDLADETPAARFVGNRGDAIGEGQIPPVIPEPGRGTEIEEEIAQGVI